MQTEKSVPPAQVPDCRVELQQEDLPAQLQQAAHTVRTAGILQQLDLAFQLLQLRSCNRQRTQIRDHSVWHPARAAVSAADPPMPSPPPQSADRGAGRPSGLLLLLLDASQLPSLEKLTR